MDEATHDSKISERFSPNDSDITIRSSDGVLFKVHKKNLEMHSEGFPGEEVATLNEIVNLTETSTTLELLFQYMYRQPQPDLGKVPFTVLASLAEAAEKYRVFPAIEVCKIYMRFGIPQNPLKVLRYAWIHGYSVLCDEAAPHTIGVSASYALQTLGFSAFIPWILYRERWNSMTNIVFDEPAVVLHRGGAEDCEDWHPFRAEIMRLFGAEPAKLSNTREHFAAHLHLLSECNHCRIRGEKWCRAIESTVADFPKISATVHRSDFH